MVVRTGGPCSGKTDSLAYFSEELSNKGFAHVFMVPEVATMVFTSGIMNIADIAASDHQRYMEIERYILRTQLMLEEHMHGFASLFPGEKSVMLLDRGAMDVAAYLEKDEFGRMLSGEQRNYYDVRDRYDVVVHLVTAAIGAEQFYTRTNNKARSENLALARLLDKRTQDAWTGAPHFRVIDNSTDFEGKLHRAFKAVARGLGIPVPLEIERKFLVRSMPDFRALGVHAQPVDIEQQYLIPNAEGNEVRIRRRSQGDTHVYYRTIKKKSPLHRFARLEQEDTITADEYRALAMYRDPRAQIIRKVRWCFVYNHQYFELDVFVTSREFYLLEVELTEESEVLTLPPFINVDRELTDDERYTNAAIARGECPLTR